MTLWLVLFGGLLLILAVSFCLRAINRAEHRARRGLYHNLGLEDVTVDYLMQRNRGVIAELTFVRGYGEAAVREAQAAAAERSRNVKQMRPRLQVVAEEPSADPAHGEAGAGPESPPD